jgi:hypothetical protein
MFAPCILRSIVSITNKCTLYLVVLIQIKLLYSLRHVSAFAGTILREFPLYLAKNYIQVVLNLVVGSVNVWQHMCCNNVESVLYIYYDVSVLL